MNRLHVEQLRAAAARLRDFTAAVKLGYALDGTRKLVQQTRSRLLVAVDEALALTASAAWVAPTGDTQRCTGCHEDLPNGAPPKCSQCAEEDATFVAAKGKDKEPARFFHGTRGGHRVHNPMFPDDDAFHRADSEGR